MSRKTSSTPTTLRAPKAMKALAKKDMRMRQMVREQP